MGRPPDWYDKSLEHEKALLGMASPKKHTDVEALRYAADVIRDVVSRDDFRGDFDAISGIHLLRDEAKRLEQSQ